LLAFTDILARRSVLLSRGESCVTLDDAFLSMRRCKPRCRHAYFGGAGDIYASARAGEVALITLHYLMLATTGAYDASLFIEAFDYFYLIICYARLRCGF